MYRLLFKHILIILFACVPSVLFSQIIEGTITDVGTRSIIDDADILFLKNGYSTQTDENGYFFVSVNELETEVTDSLHGYFYKRNNRFIWEFNTNVKVVLLNHILGKCSR